MALLTPMTLIEAQRLGARYGFGVASVHPIAQGSVNSNFRLGCDDGSSRFLRVCEESTSESVLQQNLLLHDLVGAGVDTPLPISNLEGNTVEHHRQRPVVAFAFVSGDMICQLGVRPAHAAAIGQALATIHAATPAAAHIPRSRFTWSQLSQRLESLPKGLSSELAAAADGLRVRVDAFVGRDAVSDDPTVIHGDLFRDNVLWRPNQVESSPRIAGLLDFESASAGSPLFDLAVALLAWCYGDGFMPDLAGALLQGYRDRSGATISAVGLHRELCAASVRFAITRITDFELRSRTAVAFKDYRRFVGRLEDLERGGPELVRAWLTHAK